jgi:hypothetical protein
VRTTEFVLRPQGCRSDGDDGDDASGSPENVFGMTHIPSLFYYYIVIIVISQGCDCTNLQRLQPQSCSHPLWDDPGATSVRQRSAVA